MSAQNAEDERDECEIAPSGKHMPVYEQHGFWPWQRHVECWFCYEHLDGEEGA